MAYTTTIAAQVNAAGAQGEVQELGIAGYVLNSQGSSTTTYSLVPGQELDVLANILPPTGGLNVKFYVIKATAPINVAVSIDSLVPAAYTNPAGLFYLWAGTVLGSTISALKIKAPLNGVVTTPIDVSVTIGFG